MSSSSPQGDQILAHFQKIWGYQDFRPPQREVIQSLLSFKDSLVILPTGAGKSVCFQLPALLQTGLTLVVSPLIALMENQVAQLQNRQKKALLLHGELSKSQRHQVLQSLAVSPPPLLYLSPETLLSSSVWNLLAQPDLKINGLIIDEAHCLVQWGDTFRPEYRRLGVVRQALLKNKPHTGKIPVAAFTATADPCAIDIIQKTLLLDNPDRFILNPYRSNLHLSVKIALSPRCRRHLLTQFIHSHRFESGLIYVRSRPVAEELIAYLKLHGYNCAAYHAGLHPTLRRQLEASWLADNIQFLVCTNAFGMGIDKPSLRWVVHFHTPLMLLEYLQEVGRSGRDGQNAHCLALVSEPTGWLNPEDKTRRDFFTKTLFDQYRLALKIAPLLPPQGNIETIQKQYQGGDIALSLLHSTNQLEWLDPFNYQLNLTENKISFHHLKKQYLAAQQKMTSYLYTRQCRWKFLLQAFGFADISAHFRCGHCDNCCAFRS